jgi:hypothetical protein
MNNNMSAKGYIYFNPNNGGGHEEFLKTEIEVVYPKVWEQLI